MEVFAEKVFTESRILIVDDNRANVMLVERLLEWAGYTSFRSTTDPETTLDLYESYKPDLIILDLHMPKLDGYQVMRRLASRSDPASYLPILVLTADATPEARQKALSMGASDFLTKPGDAMEIRVRVRNFLQTRHLILQLHQKNQDLEEKVAARTKSLWTSQLELLERLRRTAQLRDDNPPDHPARVGEISARIAEAMGLDRVTIELLRLAAPLHDIGKVGLSDQILARPEDSEESRAHTKIGAEVFVGGTTPFLAMAEKIARHHHERWDGTGYPDQLSGDHIPIEARIVAVADGFDTLLRDRSSQPGLSVDQAFSAVLLKSKEDYDPGVVAALFKAFRAPADRQTLFLAEPPEPESSQDAA